MSYSVSERTRESGIRLALGAEPHDVLGSVVSRSLKLTAAGLAIGLAPAVVTMRLLATILVGISPFDPLTFALACIFLAALALIASLRPAHRATRVDPAMALRND